MADFSIELHPEIINNIKELKISQIEFSHIKEKIILAGRDIEFSTARLRGLPSQFRKLKHGDKRIILWVSKSTIYVIKMFHRKKGYSEKSLRELLDLVRNYTG